MSSSAVGHGQRLEVKAFGFGPLAQYLPVVSAVVTGRRRAPGDGGAEGVRSQQPAKHVSRQDQTSANLEHFARRKCRREGGQQWLERVVGIRHVTRRRAEGRPPERKQLAFSAGTRPQRFVTIKDRQRL